jgi:hypothetical protein
VGLTTPPCKTWICLETSTEASEEEEGWEAMARKQAEAPQKKKKKQIL